MSIGMCCSGRMQSVVAVGIFLGKGMSLTLLGVQMHKTTLARVFGFLKEFFCKFEARPVCSGRAFL